MPNPYEEFFEEEDETQTVEEYIKLNDDQRRVNKQHRKRQTHNNVPVCPTLPQEVLQERQKFVESFDELHNQFPNSTGVKPFGKNQQKSIQFTHHIMKNGGRAIKLEPRGGAKTSRITNEATSAVLLGMQQYILIIANAVDKAEDILDAIKTELTTNENLERMFPDTIACFKHLDRRGQKAQYQTYNNDRTFIEFKDGRIVFPIIPDTPSSGCIIEVRPRDNLKGLFYKIPAGPDAGKIIRPTLVILDDIQTENDAYSPTKVKKIISNIKRSALKGGSHSRRVSCILNITPVCAGDVAWWFAKNEHSFEISKFPLLLSRPTHEKMWLQNYAKIYLDYDREIVGDRLRAQLAATEYFKENYEKMLEGAAVSWGWAYGWEEEPQTEIHAVQHCYNILLDDGEESFEFEIQCNLDYGTQTTETKSRAVEPGGVQCKIRDINQYELPITTTHVVSHIDVNQDVLTYMTVASPSYLQPHVVDYGFWPTGPRFKKKSPATSLRNLYQTNDIELAIEKGLRELSDMLQETEYLREDGMPKRHSLILSDCRFCEKQVFNVCRAVRYPMIPLQGIFIGGDDEKISLKSLPENQEVHGEVLEKPNNDNTLNILQHDTNEMKTLAHKLFIRDMLKKGAASLFYADSSVHRVVDEHFQTEIPFMNIGKRTGRQRIAWKAIASEVENEYFDNFVGCLAALHKLGCRDSTPSSIAQAADYIDISDYLKQ